MKFLLLLSVFIFTCMHDGYTQSVLYRDTDTITAAYIGETGFVYSPGITWTENKKQDSVLKIFVEGDTMTAIRNLLIYCMQEKDEEEHSFYILDMINLENLKKIFNNKRFNHYVADYKKVLALHKKQRRKYDY